MLASTAADPAKTVDPTLLGDRVTDAIRALIVSGELAPGNRIGQEQLAERFGTSRIPVRDALRRLESEGLVLLVPNSGAWVAELDPKECVEIYKIRERLEPLALAESVARMTDADVKELERIVVAMEASESPEEFLRLDREFHLTSYRASGMSQLNGMVERFWNTTQHYRRAYTAMLEPDRHYIMHYEHRLMLEAMKRRDAAAAEQILHGHIRRTRLEFERHAAEHSTS